MMQKSLTDIATSLSLEFLFGERTAFNKAIDKLERTKIALYHQDYFDESVSQDTQGIFEPTSNMTLFIVGVVERAPTPDQHMDTLVGLHDLAYQVLYKLDTDYVLSNIKVTPNINMGTDRYLDAVRVVVSAKPKIPVSPC